MKTLKQYLFFIAIAFFSINAFGQVGINTTNPNAILDIRSSNVATPTNTDGILIPKIDEYPLINPTATQDGMLVFATGNGSILKGFYYWDNTTTSWVTFLGATIEKIDDLIDGKSDNDGTDDGSSIFIGINAGLADDGSNNSNISVGYESLMTNSIGYRNIAIGSESLRSNTSGFDNLAYGYGALFTNTTGFGNHAIGYLTLNANTDGDGNIAIGRRAMFRNTTGSFNVALGYRAMFDHTIGGHNVAIGDNALENSTSSSLNTAIGSGAMETLVGGVNNMAVGANSLTNNSSGQENTALGANSLLNNLTGSGNAALGYGAGEANNGSNNVFLGTHSGTGSGATSSRLYIETLGATNPLVYGEFDNDLLRVNGDFEVEKLTDASITVKTPFGDKSSLKLFESGGSGDYGFEFQYDGGPDKFHLWSRTFAGNEGIRMTWLKDGKVGINDISPTALLDIEASNSATPTNTDGILIPRIDAFPSSNPTADQNGMLVFLTTDNTFYFWRNSTTSWASVSNVQKINDLIDGKSDNNGSSIFLGVDTGLNDDLTSNANVGIGKLAMKDNTIGSYNVGIGYDALSRNVIGDANVAIGNFAGRFTNGNNNVFLGSVAGGNSIDTKSGSVFIGFRAGFSEDKSNRLYIENSASLTPLIYGEFDNDLLRVNGDFEVEKNTDASITVKTPFGNKSSLKLFESGGSGDYGFEFQYDGAPDKLHLWSRTFAGNEGIRMTWLKDGKVGINDTAPIALLDIEATNSATPANTDGILIPRVDAFPATNPTEVQNGMLLFLTADNTFYYWRNSTSNWVSVSSVQKINDLSDGKSDDDGSNNGSSIFLGVNAGAIDNETNNRNVGIGYNAMSSNVTGANNTAIGSYSGPLVPGISNTTAIGYNAAPLGSNQVRIGNTSVSIIGGSAAWTVFSDRRLKTNIREDIAGLDFIKKLRPVSYNLDMDAIARFEKTPDSLRLKDAERLKALEVQTGFIAQEVEAAANEVGFDFHGIVRPNDSNGTYALRYAEFVVPLVKATQEQQNIIESQQENINTLKREIEEIKALLRKD